MPRTSLIFILTIFLASCSKQPPLPPLTKTTVDGIKLQPKTVANGKLTLLVPEEFSIMGPELLRIKYPDGRRPNEVYSNESGSVNVAVNHTKNAISQRQIGEAHTQIEAMFKKIHPNATWYNSGIIEINGRKWLTLNLTTPAADTDIRNIMIGTSVAGKLLLVAFNVTVQEEQEWLKPADAIVQSVRVNE